MSEHRYDRTSLRGDALRAAAGLILTLGPLLAVGADGAVRWVLGLGAALFLAFGLRTWMRQRIVVELTDEGICARGLAIGGLFPWGRDCVSLPWQELCMLRLRFFSTKRTQESGWMELTLKAPGRSLRLDSTLAGFREIARRAVRAANSRELDLAPATVSNLAAMGLSGELRRREAQA
ncbi:MAG: hypothetical protein HOH66_10185 [Rhodospirillaceae bacterium]|jgi:hypothetical protein|nr:hypothetical protein [Rhodospirillaceae bacterium]